MTAEAVTQQYEAEVFISLKPAVNDPEGLEIRHGLHSLGYSGVDDVRAGRYIQLVINAASEHDARSQLNEMCDRLLANPVIEEYRISLRALSASNGS
jgi:phosphoribosylformylglycinamidine synthase subunit PurS